MKNEDICSKVNQWIGTKFKHNGTVRRSYNGDGGCDCIGLVIGVFTELGIEVNGIHPCILYKLYANCKKIDANKLRDILGFYCKEVDKITSGNILLFSDFNGSGHAGIANSTDRFVHADNRRGMVVEQLLDFFWYKKLISIFSFF